MILYLDTSALVKLYVEEDGSADTRRFVTDADAIATSRVAFAETRAALAQALRLRRIDTATHEQAITAFRADWDAFSVVAVTQAVVELAADEADKLPLRGFDAIHLASALILSQRRGKTVCFLAWDRHLNRAAEATGLIVPDTLPPNVRP